MVGAVTVMPWPVVTKVVTTAVTAVMILMVEMAR